MNTPNILSQQKQFVEKLQFYILQVSRLDFKFEENRIQEIKKKDGEQLQEAHQNIADKIDMRCEIQ